MPCRELFGVGNRCFNAPGVERRVAFEQLLRSTSGGQFFKEPFDAEPGAEEGGFTTKQSGIFDDQLIERRMRSKPGLKFSFKHSGHSFSTTSIER